MKLSICMMVKNEEKNLKRCLDSLKKIMSKISSELIIVDTGSEDSTVEIAKTYTDKIYSHKWNNNFSEMRNITIGYATGEWILIIDADEEVKNEDGILQFLNMKKDSSICGASVDVKSFTNSKQERTSVNISPRVFKNDEYFHYAGSVHNEPMFKGNIMSTNSYFLHYGYISDDKELMDKKFERTSNILKKELEKNPEDVYYRFQLSISYDMYGDKENALKEIKKSYDILKKKKLDPKKYIYVYSQLASCYLENNLLEEAKSFCKEGISLEKEYIDLYYIMGRTCLLLNDNEEAIKYYEKYIYLVENYESLNISLNAMIKQNYLKSIDEAYHNLSLILYKKEEYEKALKYSRKAEQLVSTEEAFIKNNKLLILDIIFKLRDFKELKKIYIKQKECDLENNDIYLSKLVSKIERELKNIGINEYIKFIEVFSQLEDLYGEINSIRYLVNNDINLDDIKKQIISFIQNYNFNKLQDFCGDIIYYAINYNIEVSNLFFSMTENNIIRYLKYLDERYEDLAQITIKYLEKLDTKEESYDIIRCRKILIKYLLFSGYLKDNEYEIQFKKYIEQGTKFIKYLYSEYIIDNEIINDMKNVEEVFLLYILKANNDKPKYVEYLRKAVEIYPDINKGVKFLLEELERANVDPLEDEMKSLKNSFKENIKSMIAEEHLETAEELIKEYEKLFTNDIDILLFKSEIAIQKSSLDSNIH